MYITVIHKVASSKEEYVTSNFFKSNQPNAAYSVKIYMHLK